MFDFYKISTEQFGKQHPVIKVFPDFGVEHSKDLMIRGGDFYAVWNEEEKVWDKDPLYIVRKIDESISEEVKHLSEKLPANTYEPMFMKNFRTRKWKEFCEFCSSLPDNYEDLDTQVTFLNDKVGRDDHRSKRLSYALKNGNHDSFDLIMRTLYDDDNRTKIEWSIGSIVAGESKNIQKFMVLYGDPGSGKSTVLHIIEKLFEDYVIPFDAKAITTSNNSFAAEMFKTNPLVAIQHDGDLSRIEDNTRLNSIVSHENMTMNEKFKSAYSCAPNAFLFLATNKPVKITDAKSGIVRRLIEVNPSGKKLTRKEYDRAFANIDFELGAIASYCKDVYEKLGKTYYDDYIPYDMMLQTDVFFNFVEENYLAFKNADGVSLKQAYTMYKEYCGEASVDHPLPMYKFREELKNYFKEYYPVARVGEDKHQVRKYYKGFISTRFIDEENVYNEEHRQNSEKEEEQVQQTEEQPKPEEPKSKPIDIPDWLKLKKQISILDDFLSDCPAQYATKDETPQKAWDIIDTKLEDLNTRRIHYILVPLNHIVIDFDLKDENGEKSLALNLEAASKFPKTYAETSKSGQGLHLHYIFQGDPMTLNAVYAPGIEIKVFSGKSSLRRKLNTCNDIPVASISSGLPLREAKREEPKTIDFTAANGEKSLRTIILKNLRKEYHASTKCSVDFIYKVLEDAYKSGAKYDLRDLRPSVMSFAMHSSHNVDYCLKLVNKMHFMSDDAEETIDIPEQQINKDVVIEEKPIVFYDVEVFINLFVVVWKKQGPGHVFHRMINPTPAEMETLFNYRLIGFNNRDYDNHIIYARYMGYTNEQLYEISQRIISGSVNAKIREAYGISYADIYDFATTKQSLKKWEIELGINHVEWNHPWDEPVAEEDYEKVADYCENDVSATEALFDHLKEDWLARQILADISGGSTNDTTNTLTCKLIFGKEKHPDLVYTDLATGDSTDGTHKDFNAFPGYSWEYHANDNSYHNMFKEEDVGKGGLVWANPGMKGPTITLDSSSHHPSSIIALNLFGKYTPRYKDLLTTKNLLKHKKTDELMTMFDGKLQKWLQNADKSIFKGLTKAIKLALNSAYGLTSAGFTNAMRDPRNVNNIVALRGALFMALLRDEVLEQGYDVLHIKTDSIKVSNYDQSVIDYIVERGKEYGYTMEVEHVFEKICLVNNAVYIAKLSKDDPDAPGQWTATGAQFAEPYVFKTLFSHEPLIFEDYCQVKSVKDPSAIYLDFNEGLPDVSEYEEVLECRKDFPDWTQVGMESATKAHKLLQKYFSLTDDELKAKIAEGHDYRFVGKVGNFVPVREGTGGARLVCKRGNKFDSVSGGKGYRWKEAAVVKANGLDNTIDISYYDRLANEAKDTISKFGDFEWFVSDD